MRGSISLTPCWSEDDADCGHLTCVHAVLCPASTFLSDVGVFYILSSEEREQSPVSLHPGSVVPPLAPPPAGGPSCQTG